jgi:hypothetical protein
MYSSMQGKCHVLSVKDNSDFKLSHVATGHLQHRQQHFPYIVAEFDQPGYQSRKRHLLSGGHR